MADFTENQLELLSTWYTTTNHSTPPIIWLYLNDPLKDPLPQEMELLTDQCKSILGPVFQRIAPSKTRIFDRRIAATPREQDIVTEFNAIEEIKFNNNCSEKEAIKILRSAPEKYNLGHTQKYMNTASFISKCKSIHGDKYDYTPTIYVQREAKVKIVCPIHGEFEQRARNHMDGSGCVKCSYIKPTRITRPPVVKADVREPNSRNQTALASFIKRSTILHNGYYTYDNAEWGGYHAATTIHCPVHGDFYQRIGSHLKGFGCSKCAYDKRRKIEPTNDVG